MFSGIVPVQGEVVARTPRMQGLRLGLRGALRHDDLAVGASVACAGACLTVVSVQPDGDTTVWETDVSDETLRRTTIQTWTPGTPINLEPALRLGDPLGGHLVFGHVDGTVRCEALDRTGSDVAARFSRFRGAGTDLVVEKGSVALDGVSLTVNRVEPGSFGVVIVPHTREKTTLKYLEIGSILNIEHDMLARYALRAAQILRANDGEKGVAAGAQNAPEPPRSGAAPVR